MLIEAVALALFMIEGELALLVDYAVSSLFSTTLSAIGLFCAKGPEYALLEGGLLNKTITNSVNFSLSVYTNS